MMEDPILNLLLKNHSCQNQSSGDFGFSGGYGNDVRNSNW